MAQDVAAARPREAWLPRADIHSRPKPRLRGHRVLARLPASAIEGPVPDRPTPRTIEHRWNPWAGTP